MFDWNDLPQERQDLLQYIAKASTPEEKQCWKNQLIECECHMGLRDWDEYYGGKGDEK